MNCWRLNGTINKVLLSRRGMIPHRVNRAIHNYFYIDVNWTWRTAPGAGGMGNGGLFSRSDD